MTASRNIPRDPIPHEKELRIDRPDQEGRMTARFFAFNTGVALQAYGAEAACRAAFAKVRDDCRAYERLFSRTLPHSDIARLNSAGGKRVAVSPLTADVLRHALRYCAESEGTFDITVGPLVRLWDFRRGIVPDPAALAEAARHVDWRRLEVSPATEENASPSLSNRTAARNTVREGSVRPASPNGTEQAEPPPEGSLASEQPPAQSASNPSWAQLHDPCAAVDLGGIAKGWIADKLVETMRAHGLAGFVVNLGGNVAVGGKRPDGRPWRIGISDPCDPGRHLDVVEMASGSAVTSGTYERSFQRDGSLYHHVLDPRTGQPAETDAAGVTVVAERSIDAEGFSTTLLALGTECGLDLARRHPELRQVVYVLPDGTQVPLRR